MSLLFLDLYVFFGIQYEKNVASLHDTRLAPADTRTIISDTGQLELMEADLPNLGSCATPVVPELRGKGR
jgi:hypothetical protein